MITGGLGCQLCFEVSLAAGGTASRLLVLDGSEWPVYQGEPCRLELADGVVGFVAGYGPRVVYSLWRCGGVVHAASVFEGVVGPEARLVVGRARGLGVDELAHLYLRVMVARGASLLRAVASLLFRCESRGSLVVLAWPRPRLVAGVRGGSLYVYSNPHTGCVFVSNAPVRGAEEAGFHCGVYGDRVVEVVLRDGAARVRVLKSWEAYRG